MILVARILSVVFKIAGLACVVFALLLAKQVFDANAERNLSRSAFPEFYALEVVISLFVPTAAGLFLLVMGFLFDVWIVARLNRELLIRIASRVGEYEL